MAQKKGLWQLFWEFFRFGCFTFGGGWSIVAQMEKRYVTGDGSLTAEELLDLTSVGRSLPGVMIGNVAFLYGYRSRGIPGGLIAVLGLVIPPILILTGVTYGYGLIRDNVYVARAMTGVRAAVVPIIASATMRLWKGAFSYPMCYVFLLAALALNLILNLSAVFVILLGAVAGIAACEVLERRQRG